MELLREPAAQDDSADGDGMEEICKLVKEICESYEVGLAWLRLRDNGALEDVTADNAMTRTPTSCDKSQESTAGQEEMARTKIWS